MPGYELMVAKGGIKLKPAVEGHPSGSGIFMPGSASIETDLNSFARALADVLQGPVVDRTGIEGSFQINLLYDPFSLTPQGPEMVDPKQRPTIFAAVQEQLGLKLQPARVAVDILVIEHIELPGEN